MNLRVLDSPLCTLNRTTAVAPISTAVTHTSPSPCAKCPSPVEKRPPSLKTGRNSFEPLVNCLTSKLPPFSRRGTVRKPADAARARRHRPGSVWRKRKTAPVDHALLAGRPFSKFFGRRRHPGNPHERPAGDAHTRDLRRGRPAVANLPMHQKRLGHHIAQKTQARHDRAEGDRLGDDVGEVRLQ